MRFGVVLYNLGKICLVLAAAMVLPMAFELVKQEAVMGALLSAQLVMLGLGGALMMLFKKDRKTPLRNRESCGIATFAWLLAGCLGALPYIFSHTCSPIDALFESLSGFTTTGASILPDLEALPSGILIWRGLTHWLGGMGIVVLLAALASGNAANKMYKAEAPGNALTEKLAPKSDDMAQILWMTYVGISALLLGLLMLSGLNFVDALCHTFGTVSTGGFSSRNASMSAFDDNAVAQWLVVLFMAISGTNLAFYYLLFFKRRNYFWRSEEFRVYVCIILLASVAVTCSLLYNDYYPDRTLEYTIRQASFQVVNIMTTTGFYSADYDLWPSFCRIVLFCLYFLGGCAGSTSGSVKVSRWIITVKSCLASLNKTLQPRLVRSVKLDKKILPQATLNAVQVFLLIFFLLTGLGTLTMAAVGLSPFEAISVTLAALTNVGPAFESFGPTCNYISLPAFAKMFLAFYMVLGRLELMSMLVIFTRGFWRK